MHRALSFQEAALDVGWAIRRPEQLVERCQHLAGHLANIRIVLLLINAGFGTAIYGMTMHIHHGTLGMLRGAVLMPLAAGTAWLIALPTLYIYNRALDSRLSLQATILAASVTVCFGAWAMLASVSITWFFSLALPYIFVRLLINLIVFTGVGICMIDVFLRVLQVLEPGRSPIYGAAWIGLVAVIGMELFSIFGVFDL